MFCSSAMAYDPVPEYGCLFDNWGDNVTCLGLLTEAEINGADFQAALASTLPYPAIWSPFDPAQLAVIQNGSQVFNFQIDNRRHPQANRPADSRAKFAGLINSKSVPQVWAIQIDQPGDDCTPDNDWHFNTPPCDESGPINIIYDGPYPVIVYHIDWAMTPEAQEICENSGWDFTPGSPCDLVHQDTDGDGFPEAYAGTAYRSVGDPLSLETVASITWVEGNETVGPRNSEWETYWYKSWNTGANYITGGNDGPVKPESPTIFGMPFSIQAPVGNNNYIVTLTSGETFNFAQEIFSNRIMPVVSATTEGLTFQKVKNNGKVKTKTRDITVVNITARELVDEDGETRFVIQWTVPDSVLALSAYEKSLRLRIYLGNGWFAEPGTTTEPSFCWLDVPIHASTIVVPAEMYSWIKDLTLAQGGTELHVAGMYREQFPGFHNRGYFEGVTYDLTTP